jgi:hypothetical protein
VNSSLALHTAARRYCLERHSYWCDRYSEIARQGGERQRDGYHYTPEALATFPRYNVLNAIRIELERMNPTSFGDLENTRSLLAVAGETADDDFTREPIGEIDARAIAEERAGFCRYVSGLKLSDLNAVEPLPYRRVLTTAESKSIWSRLRSRWEIADGYWYPLVECTLPDIIAFDASAFNDAVTDKQLQDVLSNRGIERVWELREYGPEYEVDVSLLVPRYNGAEGYWSSPDLDWIIYASHEGSVTVGGWLVPHVKALWPSWDANAWSASLG